MMSVKQPVEGELAGEIELLRENLHAIYWRRVIESLR
jgi:hypothetical protein